MPGDTCDGVCACPQKSRGYSASERSPMPTILSTLQPQLLNANFLYITFRWPSMKLPFSKHPYFALNDQFFVMFGSLDTGSCIVSVLSDNSVRPLEHIRAHVRFDARSNFLQAKDCIVIHRISTMTSRTICNASIISRPPCLNTAVGQTCFSQRGLA